MSAIPPDTDTRPSLQDIHSAVLQTTLKTFASTEDCCVICLSELSEGCEALPCHHADFDFLCLTTWLEQQPTCSTCPLCKAEITEIRYDFSSDRAQWKTYHVPPKPAPPPQQQQQHHRSHDRTRSGPGPHTSPGHFAERRRFDLGLRRPRPSLYRTRRARGSAQDDDPLRHRRFVYRNQLYSLRVGSNRVSRYRELTPHMSATDAELVSRARMFFLRRELQVFEFLAPTSDTSTAAAADPAAAAERDPVRRRRANNAEFLLEYIVAILKTVDIQGSMGQAEELIQEFLGRENTRLLLHELRAWLRSPYMALENWDNAVFDFLAPTSDTSTAAAADPAAAAERDPVRRRRANNAEFLLEYIVAILKTVDIQGSMGQAEELVREFLGRENTRLLLHELRAWLRSPYMALENWDNAVQYPELRAKRGRSRSRSPSVEGTSRPGREQVTYPSTWRRGDSFGDRPGTSRSRFSRE
ncbi:hypothetical protein BN1723_010878 [Verticillium longisporum]|uniref:RING-type E3 ubiquitin transferase n=1 Tax=Verticillium longisporum TaxID=100787 RepID=A0A0G4L2N6_VERLO|nr:hypothetical protein BN1723_010878 [Verticillium longisporum]